MKLKALILTGLASIALTACTSSPKIPQLEVGVLQAVENLDVYPETTENKAKLTKFTDKCVIEFSGKLNDSRVVEQWAFRGLTLIDAGTASFKADQTSTAEKFDLYSPEVQKNFVALRKNFAKEALAQCE